MADGTQDTSHLYDGKTVRSAAPSRKKAAGRLKSSTEIPKDAIPEIHVPSWIESFFGGQIILYAKNLVNKILRYIKLMKLLLINF